jgi:hypothetical protein
MPDVNGGTLVVTLEGRDVNLTDLLNKVESQMQRGATTAKNFDSSIASLTATEKRNESALAAYAQAQARFAEASGNSNLAVQRLVAAMQQLTPNTAAANNVLVQLQGTLTRQAAAANQAAAAQARASAASEKALVAEAAARRESLSGVTRFAQGFQSLIGAYFAVTTAAQAFNAVISAGNELEKTQATFQALSGSAEAYEKNLAAAKAQQERFGGSLKDNIEGLSGFANLARRTGIDINELANTARALAVVDPAQGFKGASIALKEFFSGDITSLARRFELPRDRLNELKELAETDAPAAFIKLQAVLDEFGISQELLAAQANTTAVAYDKLGGAAADAFAKVGQLLAQGLKPAAEALTTALTNTSVALDQLAQAGDKKLAVTDAFFAASASADEFNARVLNANAQITQSFDESKSGILGILAGFGLLKNAMIDITAEGLKFQQVTQAQFLFAKELEVGGASIEKIREAMNATRQSAIELENTYSSMGERLNATREQFDEFSAAFLEAEQLGAGGAATAEAFFQALIDGKEPVDSLTQRLLTYVDAQRVAVSGTLDGTDATDRHTAAINENTNALSEEALAAINAEQVTAALKQRQEEIYAAALNAATGMAGAGNAAAAMAQQFGIAESAAANLINMLRNLQIAQNLAAATTATEKSFVGINALAGRAVDLKAFRAQEQALKGVNDAIRDQAYQAATAAGKVELLKNELGKLTPGTEAYIRKQTELMRAEEAVDKARAKGAKGGGAKLTANDKLNNQLLAQQEKADAQLEDLEIKHQQKLVDIIEEFAKKQLEVQQENEKLKRRSRFDFYSDLNKSELSPIDREAFAGAYEAAFQRAQEIAQSGKAKLAQEFLELKQSHLEELKALAEEEASIRADKDLKGGEKDRQLAELEARRKLLQDAQREEEKQLLEGGDKVQNELADKITEENEAYVEQADKIITNSDRAAEAKIRNAERSRIAVNEENKALATQEAIYDRIREKNGGVLPAGIQATAPTPAEVTAPPGAPAPITAPEAIPVKTDAPLAIATPEALTVKQFELFVVRDQGVIDAIGDQTIRLEGKLDTVVTTINNMSTSLGGKIDSLKSALPRGSSLVSP